MSHSSMWKQRFNSSSTTTKGSMLLNYRCFLTFWSVFDAFEIFNSSWFDSMHLWLFCHSHLKKRMSQKLLLAVYLSCILLVVCIITHSCIFIMSVITFKRYTLIICDKTFHHKIFLNSLCQYLFLMHFTNRERSTLLLVQKI